MKSGNEKPAGKRTRSGVKTSRAQSNSRSRRGDLITQAYDRLRDLIVHGRLAPGSRIIESDVADRLEISRTPVRSALQKLQQEGYIVSAIGGKNARLMVAPLTREDALELYSIVAELEALSVRWASQLTPSARAKLVRELRRLNEELLQLASADVLDTSAIFDAHTEFHWQFVVAVSAPRLQALHESIKPQAERYRRIYSTASPENVRASYEEHEFIIRSIEAGDVQAAAAAVRTNWQNSAARLSRLIEAAGERGSW